MSGEIEVESREGKAKRDDLEYYPYWYLEVKEEGTGKKITITPSWSDLKDIIVQALVHEFQVDKVLDRTEYQKWKKFVEADLKKIAQRKLEDYKIPKIIKNCKKGE